MNAPTPTPTPSPAPAVHTEGLTRSYGSMVALSSLDLTVHRGDLFGFIGSNGAGKTTTLRILSTFLTPTSGTARVLGHDVVQESDKVRRVIGYMPDFFGVYKDMEVTEYLDFFGACYKIPAARRERTVADVLELVGLSEKRGALIGALSRGMQQRLGLARVLIHDPQLLLLDEPASGLDPRARIEMMAILQELQRMGKSIIISSHILSELQSLCNRVAIIERGRLIYSGPIQGVKEQVRGGHLFRVKVGAEPDRAVAVARSVVGVTDATLRDDGFIHVMFSGESPDPAALAGALVGAGLRLMAMEEDKVGLEEVFLHVTRGETQ
jgi:ABC-2 type transport system ATP-binding protein